MSGNKCAYNKCGLSTRNDHSLNFFRFPVKDSTRCKQWIIPSGNITLPDLSPKSLSNKFLCSRHFDLRFLQHKRLPGSLDEDENIFNTVEDSSLETTEEEESSNSSKASETSNAPADTIDDFSATVESCAVVCLAGYLVKKCLDRFKCRECRVILQSEEDLADDDDLLTFYKNYNIQNSNGLKTPSNFMKQFT